MLARLKRTGWVNNVMAGTHLSFSDWSMFAVTVACTDEGMVRRLGGPCPFPPPHLPVPLPCPRPPSPVYRRSPSVIGLSNACERCGSSYHETHAGRGST